MRKKLFLVFIFIGFYSFSQTRTLSLSECYSVAKNNNLIIKNGIKDSLISAVNVRKAKDRFLPAATFSGANSYDLGTAINPSSNIRENRNRNSITGNFNFNWTVFNGFKRKLDVDVQKLNQDVVQEANKRTLRDIYLQILEVYTDLLIADEQIKVQENNAKINNTIIDIVKYRIEKGDEIKINLKNLEARKLKTDIDIRKYRNEKELLYYNLKSLLNIGDNFEIQNIDIDVDAEVMKEVETNLDNILSFPEIRIINLALEKEQRNQKMLQNSYMPKISLGYNFNSFYSHILGETDVLTSGGRVIDDNYTFFEQLKNNKNHYLALNVSVPIFSQFQNKRDREISKIEVEKLNNDLLRKKDEITNTVNRFKRDLETSYQELDYEKNYMNVLVELLDINKEKYKLGIIPLYELERFSNEYENEKVNFLQTKIKTFYLYNYLKVYFVPN
ncbi:hypothetical protein BBI01_18580 [Chryseobacterium artocarpi]|uniref:Transporter n=1 Tax=Chryseobacterium artocarpi TaxID=1414727 RepID=A0A1B8ZA06_9FLAO|nr:TolC family protein [Chryseobacterium artocarpi]OCA68451.1 hypothetical protein BBI01_18580 [Chryseobacterium artocarpi]